MATAQRFVPEDVFVLDERFDPDYIAFEAAILMKHLKCKSERNYGKSREHTFVTSLKEAEIMRRWGI